MNAEHCPHGAAPAEAALPLTPPATSAEGARAVFSGVRLARPDDEAAVYALLLDLHGENALGSLAPAKVEAMLRRGTRGEGGVIGIIDGPRGIEASIGLVMTQWWYSEEWHLEEMWNFVHPDHRRSTHAKKLVEFAKWTSDRLGVPLLLGILTRHRLLPKMRLLQRQMPQVGALFLHNADTNDTFAQRRLETPAAIGNGSVPAAGRQLHV
jgi:hypothetical protein